MGTAYAKANLIQTGTSVNHSGQTQSVQTESKVIDQKVVHHRVEKQEIAEPIPATRVAKQARVVKSSKKTANTAKNTAAVIQKKNAVGAKRKTSDSKSPRINNATGTVSVK